MLSDSGREKLRSRMIGNQLGAGRVHTEETKRLISLHKQKHPTAEGMKFCGYCRRMLSVDNFYKSKSSKDGRGVMCKECSSARGAEYYRLHCEEQKQKARNRNKSDANKASKRERNLKINYGISQEVYHKMLENQNGCCAICGVSQKGLNYKLYVDHNHSTGKVRGLLCKHCNSAIGLMDDDKRRFVKAVEYLEEND